MEALQIVKFSLKQKWVNFTNGWVTAESDMQDNDMNDGPDLLHGLSIGAEGATGKIMTAISLDNE